MNTHHPVEPPTAVIQWSAADVAKAKAAGRHDLISQAFDAGQLADVIAAPGDLAQKIHVGDLTRPSRPMDPDVAYKIHATQEGPQA